MSIQCIDYQHATVDVLANGGAVPSIHPTNSSVGTPPWTCSRTAEPFHLFSPTNSFVGSSHAPPPHYRGAVASIPVRARCNSSAVGGREGEREYPTNEFVGLSKWNSSAIHLAGRQPWHAVMIYSWGNSHRRQVAVGVTIIVCPRGDSPSHQVAVGMPIMIYS